MRRVTIGLGAVVGTVAALALAGPAAAGGASPPLWTHGMFDAAPQHIELAIQPTGAPLSQLDWRTGVVRTAPDERVDNSNFSIRPGDAVTVTLVNYTREAHTFTAPGLGISVYVHAGSATHPTKTVFTFTAASFGTYRWFCSLPCGGYMGGNVYAILKV